MKIIITEQQYSKAIDNFLTYLFEPHEVKTDRKYPDSVFWVKDNEAIAEIEKPKYFYVEHTIWNNISSMLSFEYTDMQEVIKHWLEEHYGLGSLTPTWNTMEI